MSKQAADHHKKAAEHTSTPRRITKKRQSTMRPAITRKLRTMPTSRMPTICMSPIIQRRPPNPTSNITARSNAFAGGASRFSGFTQIRVDSGARPCRVSCRKGGWIW